MPDTKTQTILFDNGRQAVAAFATALATPQQLATALALPSPEAVVLCLGGAASLNASLFPLLTQLYSRGVARAVLGAKAMVLSGGTKAGVMQLMGEGLASREAPYTLVGVAPQSRVSHPGGEGGDVPLEPNHTHFVLTDGENWGSETATLFKLFAHLTGAKAGGKPVVPAVALLVGGGSVAKDEVLRCVRLNLPVVVIEGTGGLADAVAAAHRQKDQPVEDPVMAEIVADGALSFYLLDKSVKGMEKLITRQLGSDNVLQQAWETFANYDLNAERHQRRFGLLQRLIIGLGVLGTALVVVQQVWAPRNAETNEVQNTGVWWFVSRLLIVVPILLTVLVSAVSRFKHGTKALLLRAGAEAIKKEIYCYRTRALNYAANAAQELAKRVEEVTRRTMRTEVNLSAMAVYNKAAGFPPRMDAAAGGDDGFSILTPDRYVAVRLGDQLRYFQSRTVFFEKQIRLFSWLTFFIGGLGTYLAATNMQAWVALTTSVVAAFGTYLGYRQTESSLMKYNQAATDLTNVKSWWEALSAEEQSDAANINSLVEHTERVLQTELEGWVQNMQNALADLRKEQDEAEESRSLSRQAPSPTRQAPSPPNVGGTAVAEAPVEEETTPAAEGEEEGTGLESTADEMPVVEDDSEVKSPKEKEAEAITPVGEFG